MSAHGRTRSTSVLIAKGWKWDVANVPFHERGYQQASSFAAKRVVAIRGANRRPGIKCCLPSPRHGRLLAFGDVGGAPEAAVPAAKDKQAAAA